MCVQEGHHGASTTKIIQKMTTGDDKRCSHTVGNSYNNDMLTGDDDDDDNHHHSLGNKTPGSQAGGLAPYDKGHTTLTIVRMMSPNYNAA